MNKRYCKPWQITLFSIVLAFVSQIAAAEPGANLIYSIDFSQQADGSALDWLEQHGYVIKLDARKLNPRFENHQLVLSTNDKLAGLIGIPMKADKLLDNIERVEIEWSVSRHPEGANWEKGNNRVALAVMVFFGTEKLSSGLPFGINAAPYFFSPFIGKVEPPGKMYEGKLYKEGGRYFSVVASNASGGIFTTDFELRQRFIKTFAKNKVPPISAVAFQMNTQDTSGGAIASIRRINFFGTQ